jgi:hypothetical protein
LEARFNSQGGRWRSQSLPNLMRTIILFLLTLIPVAATAALYGFLESSANMVEMLLIPFTTDKTAGGALVIGGPFLLLFIVAALAVFIAVPLIACSIAACLGGWGLRQSGRSISSRSGMIAIILTAAFTFALVLAASPSDGGFLVSRPLKSPKTPSALLACFAAANAAFSLFVATLILCRMTRDRRPPPIPDRVHLV